MAQRNYNDRIQMVTAPLDPVDTMEIGVWNPSPANPPRNNQQILDSFGMKPWNLPSDVARHPPRQYNPTVGRPTRSRWPSPNLDLGRSFPRMQNTRNPLTWGRGFHARNNHGYPAHTEDQYHNLAAVVRPPARTRRHAVTSEVSYQNNFRSPLQGLSHSNTVTSDTVLLVHEESRVEDGSHVEKKKRWGPRPTRNGNGPRSYRARWFRARPERVPVHPDTFTNPLLRKANGEEDCETGNCSKREQADSPS